MLTGITLENFKAFKAPQYIPIKPITLVFGPNSAGKSSIVQALAFLKHVHQTNGNCDPGRMTYGWSTLELGSWQNLIFGHDKTSTMKIKLHTASISIQWWFENTSYGPKVTTFEIEENGVATARGKNIGNDGIRWCVEIHSSHRLWTAYKAALWQKITGREFQSSPTLAEQAEYVSEQETCKYTHGPDARPVSDCGNLQQDIYQEHFNDWLGDTWRVPPIGCDPTPEDSGQPFEGLFPRRAFSDTSSFASA